MPPRTIDESRELLGRIVGDRGIARLVFGTECHSMRVKTVALSTQVDVVSDDAIPNIHRALRDNGCEPRPYVKGTFGGTEVEQADCPVKGRHFSGPHDGGHDKVKQHGH